MWENILLLLPRHYTSREVEFHRHRVLNTYRQLVDRFHVTGHRDRLAIVATGRRLHYSMNVLRCQDRQTWEQINGTHRDLMKLHKDLFQPAIAAAIVSRP